MLQSEKDQADQVFINAGRKAFMLDIHIQDNPYVLSYYRNLWEVGYRQAKRFFEPPKPNAYKPKEIDRRRREHKPKVQ